MGPWGYFLRQNLSQLRAFQHFSHYSPESTVLLLLGVWQTAEGENARPRVKRSSLVFLIGFIGKVYSQTTLMKS